MAVPAGTFTSSLGPAGVSGGEGGREGGREGGGREGGRGRGGRGGREGEVTYQHGMSKEKSLVASSPTQEAKCINRCTHVSPSMYKCSPGSKSDGA